MKENKSMLKSTIIQAVMRGCTLAVLILFAFFLIMSAVAAGNGTTEQGMTFSSMLTLVLFSLVISFAQEILRAKSLPTPARWAINFVVVGIAYFFVVLRSGILTASGDAFYVVGMLLYAIVYALIAGGTALIHRLRRKTESEAADKPIYTSRFS
jgi:peptidoglycan/LPS O-acetylase OafA/YrhL